MYFSVSQYLKSVSVLYKNIKLDEEKGAHYQPNYLQPTTVLYKHIHCHWAMPAYLAPYIRQEQIHAVYADMQLLSIKSSMALKVLKHI